MTENQMFLALTYYGNATFSFLDHIVLRNVGRALWLDHEADIISICIPTRFMTEIELKTSVADLKKDFLKPHKHKSKYIRQLYYAAPEFMREKMLELVPKHAGIITINESGNGSILRRRAQLNKNAVPLDNMMLDKVRQIQSTRYIRMSAMLHENEQLIKYLREKDKVLGK